MDWKHTQLLTYSFFRSGIWAWLVSASESLPGCSQRVTRASVIPGLNRTKAQVHILVGRIDFPAGCQMEGLRSLLGGWLEVASCSLPCGPLPLGSLLPHHVQAKKATERVSEKWKSQSFVTPKSAHHFYHILFIRSKSLGSAHLQGQGITQWYKYEEGGIVKDCLRNQCYSPRSYR